MKKIILIFCLILIVDGINSQNRSAYSNSDYQVHKINPVRADEINPNKPLEIFFLGNSFTAANNMPDIVQQLANVAGLNCYIETYAPGGQFSTDHCLNPYVYETIRSRKWDYVVIQDNQGAYVNQPPYVSSNYLSANFQLCDSIKANDICTSVIWFAGWAGEGGYPTYFPGDNTQSCIERVLANVVYLNSTKHEVVGPIGEGWIRSLNEQPSIDLYSPDGNHPSLEGSYITASVLFSLMFKYNPVNLNYDGGVNSTDATYLRLTGFEVVSDLNNQEEYNIISITPQIFLDQTSLITNEPYNAYLWLFDTNILPNEINNNLNFITQGVYSVFVLDNNYCQHRSFDQEFGPLTTAMFTYSNDNGTITFTNLSQYASNWDWDFGDGSYSTDENPVHTYLNSGLYTVMLISSGSTGFANYSEEITITLSVESISTKGEIIIYPNPCSDFINISIKDNQSILTVEIYNVDGKLVKVINYNDDLNTTQTIDIKNMTKGKYFLKFCSENGIYSASFVVK